MKQTLYWILLAILIFHIGLTALSVYTFFMNDGGLSRYQLYPLFLLTYTLVWFGIFQRKRFFVYFYFLLCMLELGFRVIPAFEHWKDILGDVLFPANLLFLALVVIAWNSIFSNNES